MRHSLRIVLLLAFLTLVGCKDEKTIAPKGPVPEQPKGLPSSANPDGKNKPNSPPENVKP
jgi:hypothetical protein